MNYTVKLQGKVGRRWASISTSDRGYRQSVAEVREAEGHVTVWTSEDGKSVSFDGSFAEAVGKTVESLADVL